MFYDPRHSASEPQFLGKGGAGGVINREPGALPAVPPTHASDNTRVIPARFQCFEK